MIIEWEADRSKANPFETIALGMYFTFLKSVTLFDTCIAGITQASVRLELSQLEGQQLSDGVDSSLHPEVSPSVLIASGIDLEALQ